VFTRIDVVAVDLTSGRSTMEIRNLHMKDFFDLENCWSCADSAGE
jgi:hypothetical protein